MSSHRMNRRSKLATSAAGLLSKASRAFGLGAGSTVGGRAGLLVDPHLLATLSQSRTITLVSGTNGKTTTTAFIVQALGGPDRVAFSAEGANLPPGIVAALTDAPPGMPAVLEVDEAYVPEVLKETSPKVILLSNLSRDQLDRTNEVRLLTQRWHDMLTDYSGMVIANADDPLVTWATLEAANVKFVEVGGLWHKDAHHCPKCDSSITFTTETKSSLLQSSESQNYYEWHCSSCDLRKPKTVGKLTEKGLELPDGTVLSVNLMLPGRFNRANAVLAAFAAKELGVPFEASLAEMAKLEAVAGRFSTVDIDNIKVKLMLAKNPAGWTEMIAELKKSTAPIVIGINSKIADGLDPSWLYDVPFEELHMREIVATGERARDLGVRLRHANVNYHIEPDIASAIKLIHSRTIDFVGNYTAFQDIRKIAEEEEGQEGVFTAYQNRKMTGADGRQSSPVAHTPMPTRVTSISDSKLTIVLVHPDLLGTYADSGNATVLKDRAMWRGIPAEILQIDSNMKIPETGNIYLFGGGEDGPQLRAASLIKASGIKRAVAAGAVILAVCAGFQIMGESFVGPDSQLLDGLSLIDARTVRPSSPRAVGEIVTESTIKEVGFLTGFENHAGKTLLGKGTRPLGNLIKGMGNNDGSVEGAIENKIICTYMHGPVLARNPALADYLLQLATSEQLSPLDNSVEEALRAERFSGVDLTQKKATTVFTTGKQAPTHRKK